ncbi:transporter substrate-binding domain-containing protein [Lysinibacillus piscis]|uniref:Amino acid ABC transporter substrate-binding protein n=1 Tax=Lysinibacillus piscis TaxID=2518931 RepID=A0ABQ5NN56_9BACI|nr:transporter substrate-binding domain-containing protein [Lysinibacillus sp. KH24]GLC89788.1 amino acid ABC transporter substrate-binding protein [Lysinibacillus sp. KH24]
MKKLFASLALTAGLLAACGTSDETKQEDQVNKLQEIQDEGVIQIGLEGAFPPFSYHDKSGKLTGFEYEIAEQIAKDLGVKSEFIETKWDSLIAGLDTDKYDFVINNISITDERKEKYDFSIPYMESVAVLAVQKDNTDIQKIEDLKGKKAAQTITSNFAKDAEGLGAEIVPATDLTSSLELVTQGRADGTIHDRVTFLTYLKEQPDAQLKIVEGSSSSSDIGLILNKGNAEFRDKLDEIIKKRSEDGTFAAISEKYFAEDIIKSN